MSGLAGLLAGRVPAGVYRWTSSTDVADLRSAVEHAGFGFGHVDGWRQPDRTEVLAALGSTLGFPDWYGVNLDALADCLADVAEPHIVVWDGWTVLADEDRPGLEAVVDVFAERAARAPHVSLLLRSSREIPGPGARLS